MSRTVDERVVSMQFDNKHFEKNASTTLSTLDKLKEKLSFKGASQGLEEINNASKRVDMSALGNGIETVKAKFSALQIIGITALQNITNSAVNAGKRIVSSLTIEPVRTGLAEYETQLNSVQTILANTESKGSTLKDVNAALDELNTYADKTIYNFTEMTRNIGTFTAAGVDLETATNAIQGIANLAAVSGSTSQQASTAMYQLSQALASGTVKLMDWNSVVNAGMGGQVFQDALKETAKVHGIAIDDIIEKQGSFRESLSEGWLTSEILTETLQKFTLGTEGLTEAQIEQNRQMLKAKGYTDQQIEEIFKLGDTATNAATKVKTFSQLLDTLKEAAQSGWAQTWELIIGDFEEAKSLWTKVSDVIGGAIGKSAEARNKLLEGALSSGWKQLLGEGIMDEEGYTHFIKETAKEHGVAIDEMIEKEGSFEKALQKGLQTGELSSDMLSDALNRFTESRSNMSDEQLENLGYTKEEITKLSELNEQIQNGSISMDEFSDKIKKLSGRELIMQSFANIWKSLVSFVKPIKEAFRDIFPPTTSDQLYKILENISKLTSKFILNEEQADKLKRTFKGLFAVLDIVVTVVKTIVSAFTKLIGKFTGVGDGVLSATASFGDFLVNIRDTIKESSGLVKVTGIIVDAIGHVIDAVVKLGSAIREKIKASGFDSLMGVLKKVWEVFSSIIGKIVTLMGDTFTGNGNILDSILAIFSTGLIASLVVKLKQIFESFGEVAGTFGDIIDSITGPLQGLQDKLKAEALQKIGVAIALLAGSLLVLSLIESDKLKSAIGALVISLGVLIGALAILGKIKSGSLKSVSSLVGISAALLTLSISLAILGTMGWDKIWRALTVMTLALGVLIGSLAAMSKIVKANNILGLYVMTISLVNLGLALKILGSMSWEDIGQALTAMSGSLGILLLTLTAMSKIGKANNIAGLYVMTISLVNLGIALKILGSMSWEDIGQALTSMSGALGILLITLTAMSKIGKAKNIAGLYVMTASLINLGLALKILGSMDWSDIGRALTAMLGAITILVAALAIMSKISGGVSMLMVASALLVMAGAINLLVPALVLLGNLNIGTILKGLLAIAGALAVFAAASILMSAAIPSMLALGAATALLGAGLFLIGTGLTAISVGLAALTAGTMGGLKVLVDSLLILLKGIIELIPLIVEALAKGIILFCEVIAEGAPSIGKAIANLLIAAIDACVAVIPKLADGIFKILLGVLKSLVKYLPKIVEVLVDLLVQLIKNISKFLPKIIQAAIEVLAEFFEGVINALKGMDSDTIIKAILAVGLLAGLMAALAAIVGLIPGAMACVLGMGVVVAELAIVLAAIGALSNIPGLSNLISDGGNLLQTIGTAIGQFIGGLIGGIGQGITGSLPQMASDLSIFMTNLQPFINGIKLIDSSVLESAKTLASTLLVITGSSILERLTSWISGGSSMATFGAEIASFGIGLKRFATEVQGIDPASVIAASNAAKALADMTSHIPNQGGIVAWFTGENSVSKFSSDLITLGNGLMGFYTSTLGIVPENITAAANAAKSLADMTNIIPSEGGIKAWFSGESSISKFANQLPTLGKGLKGFSDSVAGISTDNITSAANAAKSLATMTNTVPKDTGKITKFGDNLVDFGESLGKYFSNTKSITSGSITVMKNAVDAIKNISNGLDSSAIKSAAKAIDEMVKSLKKTSGVKSDATSGFVNSLNKLGKTSVDTIVKSFEDIKSKMETVGKEAIESFINGIENKEQTVIKACTSLVKACADAISSKASEFSKAGSNLVNGFANGISQNTYKAEAKAKAMASAAANAAKKELDEHSPSKVGYEIGDFFGVAFVNAIEDYASVAYDAGSSIAESAKIGLSNAAAKIADVINSDMDTRPTIQPVLDLSEIKSGAGAINSLLGFGPSIGVLSKANSISASMNKNQNGSNDVASAIKDLKNTMANSSGNTYNFNGITYDDGSNIADAVATIVRAARIERRR